MYLEVNVTLTPKVSKVLIVERTPVAPASPVRTIALLDEFECAIASAAVAANLIATVVLPVVVLPALS